MQSGKDITFKYLNESIESIKCTINFHIVTMPTVIFKSWSKLYPFRKFSWVRVFNIEYLSLFSSFLLLNSLIDISAFGRISSPEMFGIRKLILSYSVLNSKVALAGMQAREGGGQQNKFSCNIWKSQYCHYGTNAFTAQSGNFTNLFLGFFPSKWEQKILENSEFDFRDKCCE